MVVPVRQLTKISRDRQKNGRRLQGCWCPSILGHWLGKHLGQLTIGTDYGQDTIESAGVFLFKTFHNKDQIGHEETRAIKQMFGPFPASAAEMSCAAVGRLVAQIGESQVDAFIQTQSSLKTVNRSSIFGRNIAFSFDTYVLDAQDTLPWSEGTDTEQDMDFHSFLNNHVGERRAGGDRDDAYSAEELERRNADSSILRQEVEKYLNEGNMVSSSAEELFTSLFEMLASTRSDDELQNELFEFLGPQGFEMISKLLQSRSDIVDSLVAIPLDSRPHFTSDAEYQDLQSLNAAHIRDGNTTQCSH
ncbi:Activating signal cointegrator 1 complex subunit 3 [Labeo rohita]|uniref:Activating signal cointegrator 1 complex subunit 3 n=1 Tax=Labeo rohita TaxID=84645 RepID=A0ABQ8LYL2_LABRO|nr:Activating signal cointegrator 1 complex subunit 3 [Labeo rohita]